jgi:hypothetical protein
MSMEAGLVAAVASIFNCAVLMPDYAGYGTSKQVSHPYVHAESLGENSFDFIKAICRYVEEGGERTLSRRIVNIGYSEGGYAAVALHRTIQEAGTEFRVVKTYAGAGPYDHVAISRELVERTEDLDAEYLSSYLWVLSVYREYMGYTKPYGEIYSAEDNAIFQANHYDFAYLIEYRINRNPARLFQPAFIEGIRNSTDTELLTLAEKNSLTGFTPVDSLVLFHSEADEWVFPVNTINAYNSMKSRGAPVRMELLPASERRGHAGAAPFFLESVFFNLLLTGVIG